ncbi:uncharacterized protein LOC131153693 [Malania oleifera]|uniref:uncharacterized protein LOC131153693 n=1 Tax=Malania oleifera TaxID=397392 RepID=UPI0025AEA5C4|nr:uncharacterized protein LOC131153693 [Malania oleifera]
MVDVESGHIRTEVESSLEGTRWDGVSEFGKGMIFNTKDDLIHSVRVHHAQTHHKFKVVQSTQTTWMVRCNADETCVWRLRATQRKKHGLFEITQYRGPHTCINETLSQDHPQLKSTLVANEVVEIIKSDAGASIAALQTHLRSKYQYHVSYRKVWLGKQRAVARVFGDWDISNQLLPKWMHAMCEINPGTKVKWAWTEIPDANNAAILTCVFWSFAASIEGFRHCPPVLYVDGTHLYEKYKDRHVGILAAIRQNDDWQPPRAHHRFCLHHIVSNFNQRVHNTMLKRMVEIAGREHQVRKFNSMMERILREGGPIAKSFFEEIPPHIWTQCHDGGRSARREASRQAMESGNGYTPHMLLQMQRREMAYAGHEVINFNIERGLFSIQTAPRPPNKGRNIQTVDIKGRRCTCGKWQNLHYPCSHLLVVCGAKRLGFRTYIDPCFTVQEHYATYAMDFIPILHEHYWRDPVAPILYGNRNLLRQKGRPKSSRLRNEMDVREGSRRMRCGFCHQEGHNRNRCPRRTGGHDNAGPS